MMGNSELVEKIKDYPYRTSRYKIPNTLWPQVWNHRILAHLSNVKEPIKRKAKVPWSKLVE